MVSQEVGLILIRAAAAILAAAVGALIGMFGRKSSHGTLCALVCFASGALLCVALLHIVPETAHMLGWVPAVGTVIAGIVIFYAIGRYVAYVCPACTGAGHHTDHSYFRLGLLMMAAMAIHSTMDGLAIAAGTKASDRLALVVLFAVAYHKIPEGLALASVTRLAGYSKPRALGLTVLIEMTTGLGALIGILALNSLSEMWLGVTLGIVGGSFLYVVGIALTKEIVEHENKSVIAFMALGFASILAVGFVMDAFGLAHHHVH